MRLCSEVPQGRTPAPEPRTRTVRLATGGCPAPVSDHLTNAAPNRIGNPVGRSAGQQSEDAGAGEAAGRAAVSRGSGPAFA